MLSASINKWPNVTYAVSGFTEVVNEYRRIFLQILTQNGPATAATRKKIKLIKLILTAKFVTLKLRVH